MLPFPMFCHCGVLQSWRGPRQAPGHEDGSFQLREQWQKQGADGALSYTTQSFIPLLFYSRQLVCTYINTTQTEWIWVWLRRLYIRESNFAAEASNNFLFFFHAFSWGKNHKNQMIILKQVSLIFLRPIENIHWWRFHHASPSGIVSSGLL